MIPGMVKFSFTAGAAVLLLACTPGVQDTASAQNPSEVGGRVGDRTFTIQQLDERWRELDPTQHAQATDLLYEGRRAALDDIIANLVLEKAAAAKGIPVPEYLEAETQARLTPVTDNAVAAFYAENRGQMQGRPLEAMSGAIRQFLEERAVEDARNRLIAELRSADPSISVLLEPPRRPVQIADTDPVLGPASAPVTIVEYSDFQCPFCARVAPTLKQLRETYGDRIRIVWKDFPLTQIHPQAFKASEAGWCADEQDKYWEYHDRLFENQQALTDADLKRHAASLGLDARRFDECLDSSRHAERVRAGLGEGARLGITSTPTLFINGRTVAGAQPYEVFSRIIDEELARAR